MISKRAILYGPLLFLAACASLDPELVTRPDDELRFTGSRTELNDAGAKLWTDPSIGNSGLSCSNCHMNNAQFKTTFVSPYPHKVAMANNMAKLQEVTTEQMVQLCMVVPMKGDPLPWDSMELAALSAYVDNVVQPKYAASQR